jgi:hypothetical protein
MFSHERRKRYRLILIPKSLVATNNPDITFSEFKEITSMISQTPIEVTDPDWLTRFSLHHRMATSFRKGHVFIVLAMSEIPVARQEIMRRSTPQP